jgi:TolB-like protein/tetratricopeptide (TPR) repeat protein
MVPLRARTRIGRHRMARPRARSYHLSFVNSDPRSSPHESRVPRTAATVPAVPRIPDYELLRRIGAGAYGEVWLARGVTGALRAVKIVRRDRFADSDPYEREFRGVTQACEAAGQVALLHVSRHDDEGFFYYVMELADDAVSGRTIDPERYVPLTLKELHARRGRIAAARCVPFGIALARGLAALHARGLVHRDIKPSNIVLVEGVPKLADVGLMAAVETATSRIGTEGFIPPEGPGSPAADVFALGKVLYELATGCDADEFPRLPPDLGPPAERRAVLRLNDVIVRACEPDRARRYRDASPLLKDLMALQAGRMVRGSWHRRWRAPVAIAVTVALGAAGVTLYWRSASRQRTSVSGVAPAPAGKAIAVLPFENLSTDPENAFFAEGIQQDVLTRLAWIGELRVLSRGSVLQYRGTQKPLKQIGQELGVAYLLCGSVAWSGDRAHLTAQLVNAQSETIAWAATYDRDVRDVFAVQAEITTAIADSLHAKLTAGAARWLAQGGTTNPTAYAAFLKGRESPVRSATSYSPAHVTENLLLVRQAVALDPSFAEAWALLAQAEAFSARFDADPTRSHAASAVAALDRALQLAPGSPDVEIAAAYVDYDLRHDYARAGERFERLLVLQPNNAALYDGLALVRRRQDRWSEALAHGRRAVALEPRNPQYADTLRHTLLAVRRFDEAVALQTAIAALYPDDLLQQYILAVTLFSATGSMTPLKIFRNRLTPAQRETAVGRECLKVVACYYRDVAEVARLDRRTDDHESLLSNPDALLDTTTIVLLLAAQGDHAGAVARLGSLPQALRSRAEKQPAGAPVLQALAWAEMILENPEAAERYMNRAVEAEPSNRLIRLDRAGLLSWLGKRDAALAELTELFKYPVLDLWPAELRASVFTEPLHGDPRFEALLSDPRNTAPLF